MIDYTGQTALVTGAASGIGAELARQLAGRGARVVCADRQADALEALTAELGAGAAALHCDLADPGGAGQLFSEALAVTGSLDLLCSNAGIGFSGDIATTEFDTAMEKMFQVNFFAGMKLAQAYILHLEASKRRGRMLVTASENSLSLPAAVRGGQMAYYGATKHALLIAMEWFRIEQEAGPMELHVLMPGAVYTPLVSSLLPDPSLAPPELELIMPDQCAERALRGMDLGLFYIPTQAHLHDDMQPRSEAVAASLRALGIERTYQAESGVID